MTPDEAIAIVKSKANGHDVTEIQFALAAAVLADATERLQRRVYLLEKFRSLMEHQLPTTAVVLDETDDAVSRAMKPAFEEKP